MPRHPPNALKRLIQSQPSHTEIKAPQREAITLSQSPASTLLSTSSCYPPGHSSHGPPQGRQFLALARSGQTATARQPAQTASRIPIHNVKDQKPDVGRQKSVTTSAPTSDLSRSSQHGTVSTGSDRSPPALPSARFADPLEDLTGSWWSRTFDIVGSGGAALFKESGRLWWSRPGSNR